MSCIAYSRWKGARMSTVRRTFYAPYQVLDFKCNLLTHCVACSLWTEARTSSVRRTLYQFLNFKCNLLTHCTVFSLQPLDGSQNVSLSEYAGSVVLLVNVATY